MTVRQGTVVKEFDPYWRVVDRGESHKRAERYVVVDSSVEPAQQVHGPTTKKDAEAFCRVNAQLFLATKGQGEWT